MKKILIISPHFPPSNLAGVHRSRLFAQHLSKFGWEPLILTVDEKYYEEILDPNLANLLPQGLRIEKVNAFRVTKPRLIGDLGLRAFIQLYKKAKLLINNEEIDFLYIPIPSFYTALLGRLLHKSTNIRYGIDYIDPWVHYFPGTQIKFSRHWWSTKLAAILEPIALKKVSLITGVAEGYYEGVKRRNPKLLSSVIFGAMPYGGEVLDHDAVRWLSAKPYLFKGSEKIKIVYAGAMLPKAHEPLEAIFRSIKENLELFENIEIHFIGTGKKPNDPASYNIKSTAEKYGLWENLVFEHPKRIPYLDVLIHLEASNGVLILGSTEPHYTPSKVYQAVLARKPIFAVLHELSSAVKVIFEARAGDVLPFNGADGISDIYDQFSLKFKGYLESLESFDPSNVDSTIFENYSAKSVTAKLADLLCKVMENE